jgi:hypothetical protein
MNANTELLINSGIHAGGTIRTHSRSVSTLSLLSALVASARLCWLRTHDKFHDRINKLRLRCGLRPKPRTVLFANIAEGTHLGNITKAADAAISERFLLAKVGSASDRVAVAGAADTPIGVITDEAAATGDLVNVALLGCGGSTVRMVASGAITQGSLVEPAASGRIQTLSGAAGTHNVVGRALDAASNAGDVIEVDPFYFIREI